MGRTSIVVVSYNNSADLPDCVRALERAGLDPALTRLILVDNASSDGSADLIRRQLLAADGQRTSGGLPALFIHNPENLGFAGGNNVAFRRAIADGDEFVYMLNPDTEVEPGFLEEALAAARADPRIALVQSLVLRHPDSDVVNTYGNALHYLGFGYAAGDGSCVDDPQVRSLLSAVRDIPFASGAAALARTAALEAIGLFNEELFVYCEDTELGWRARLAGWRVVFAPRSRVRHKYEFSRGTAKYYWLERNRVLVLAWCYRAPTLALLAPALLAMEAGLWAFALRGGWWREKGRAYRYLADPRRWPKVLETRRRVQALRAADDRDLAALASGEIVFPAVSPWLLTRVANPLLDGYWRVVRALLRW
jgi:GT2 family glycosyltransferase